MAVLLLILPVHWNIIKLNNWIGQLAGQNHWSQEVLHQCQTKRMPTMSILCAQIVQLYFFCLLPNLYKITLKLNMDQRVIFWKPIGCRPAELFGLIVGLFCYIVDVVFLDHSEWCIIVQFEYADIGIFLHWKGYSLM